MTDTTPHEGIRRDPVAEHLSDLSAAIRSLIAGVEQQGRETREAIAECHARVSSVARAVGDLAAEVRGFARSEERLRGQLALVATMVSEHERERGGNGAADA